jgi:hypothetical protein
LVAPETVAVNDCVARVAMVIKDGDIETLTCAVNRLENAATSETRRPNFTANAK